MNWCRLFSYESIIPVLNSHSGFFKQLNRILLAYCIYDKHMLEVEIELIYMYSYMTAHVCCILEVNTPRTAIHNAEVKPTCGKPTYCYNLITAECVEVLKGYSMFCLHMTTGRWLTLSTISLSLSPLSLCLSGCISIYLYIFLNLENSLSDKVWFGLKCLKRERRKIEICSKRRQMGQRKPDSIGREILS